MGIGLARASLLVAAQESGALLFSETGFTLKSKRLSPYFFNAAKLGSGTNYAVLGAGYACAIMEPGVFDVDNNATVLFGPAYKGIPLATAASLMLSLHYRRNVPVAFNRKEVKDHGDGGELVGANLHGKRVIMIDDVITAGTAVRESKAIIEKHGGVLEGVLTILDRQERGINTDLSAMEQVRQEFGIQATSILMFEDVLINSERTQSLSIVEAMRKYREEWGVQNK